MVGWLDYSIIPTLTTCGRLTLRTHIIIPACSLPAVPRHCMPASALGNTNHHPGVQSPWVISRIRAPCRTPLREVDSSAPYGFQDTPPSPRHCMPASALGNTRNLPGVQSPGVISGIQAPFRTPLQGADSSTPRWMPGDTIHPHVTACRRLQSGTHSFIPACSPLRCSVVSGRPFGRPYVG